MFLARLSKSSAFVASVPVKGSEGEEEGGDGEQGLLLSRVKLEVPCGALRFGVVGRLPSTEFPRLLGRPKAGAKLGCRTLKPGTLLPAPARSPLLSEPPLWSLRWSFREPD